MQAERYLKISLPMSASEMIKVRNANLPGIPRWGENDYSSTMDEDRLCQYLVQRNAPQYESVSVEPLREGQIVHMDGDFTFIDPFKVFFRNIRSATYLCELKRQLQHLQQLGFYDFTIIYKSHVSYFLSSRSWDTDTAFEISRQGRSLGCAELPSRFIGILPRTLLDLLRSENADQDEDMQLHGDGGHFGDDEEDMQLREDDGVSVVTGDGVCVGHVNGELIRSGDGDFVISGPKDACPPRKISRWIEDECVQHADILGATGGMWTFCDDSSDEEEEEDDWMNIHEDEF